MNFDGHCCAELFHAAGGFCLPAGWPSCVAAAPLTFDRWVDALPLGISMLAAAVSGVAIFFAVRARNLAHSALQEAGEAKARAQASGPPLSSETLAATERVWTARLNAIEAQIQTNLSRPSRSAVSPEHQQLSDLAGRVEQTEKTLHGLSTLVAQGRRPSVASPSSSLPPLPLTPSLPPIPELQWPVVLKIEKQRVKELRDLLQEGAKTAPGDLENLFQKLNGADAWSPKRRPSPAELLSFLADVSESFHAVLRKGASLPAHEVSRMSDRFAALLRPLWQKFHPEVDCRIFYPGASFDPEWMDDLNSAGLRRPTISDVFSWAVHEKHPSGRKLIAKARVTTE